MSLCEIKVGEMYCEQRKLLYLLEQTKNKPPTEARYVGVNATALTLSNQEERADGHTKTTFKTKAVEGDHWSSSLCIHSKLSH